MIGAENAYRYRAGKSENGGVQMAQNQGNGKGVTKIICAVVAAYVLTALLLFGLAFGMQKWQLDVKTAELLILFIYVLSCFAGGWYAGRKTERKKFLQGLLTGILYFVLLFLLSGLSDREIQSDLLQGILAFFVCAAGGMLGGMLA